MSKISKIIFLLVSVLLFIYVFPKSPEFPRELPNSVQSFEPADVETPLRRGYYTNLTRQEVIEHYEREFNKGFFYVFRLNYPPEEAQTIIRDQTKSSFLEEIVHPLRENLYINGFEPKTEEYKLMINGVHWNQKIIVRFVPSPLWIRLVVIILTIVSLLLLVREYKYAKK
ncbi:MAG TPA: hypothetical protein VI795_01165 [Patescibacteria group bacterium]|nr:hypothetical protein [Patescibacteria group bacterium]